MQSSFALTHVSVINFKNIARWETTAIRRLRDDVVWENGKLTHISGNGMGTRCDITKHQVLSKSFYKHATKVYVKGVMADDKYRDNAFLFSVL